MGGIYPRTHPTLGCPQQSRRRHHQFVGGIASASRHALSRLGGAALLVVHILLRAIHRLFVHHRHLTQTMGRTRTHHLSPRAIAHPDDSGYSIGTNWLFQKQIILDGIWHRRIHLILEYSAPLLAQSPSHTHWPHLPHHHLIWARLSPATSQIQLCHGGLWISHQPRSPALHLAIPHPLTHRNRRIKPLWHHRGQRLWQRSLATASRRLHRICPVWPLHGAATYWNRHPRALATRCRGQNRTPVLPHLSNRPDHLAHLCQRLDVRAGHFPIGHCSTTRPALDLLHRPG